MSKFEISCISAADYSRQIHELMQEAYTVEAQLLELEDFFPLQRSQEHISDSGNRFFGCFVSSELIGVCELEDMSDSELLIASLVVKPRFFRRGVARSLLTYVIKKHSGKFLFVSTAEKNLPAISLYEALGFRLYETKILPDGLRLSKLRLVNS